MKHIIALVLHAVGYLGCLHKRNTKGLAGLPSEGVARSGIRQKAIVGTCLAIGFATAMQAMGEEYIVASGLGMTEGKAIEEALRSAVQQSVGVYMDADTITANEDVIKDEILSYSAGFVEDYKKLGVSQKDGLVEVKLSVKVVKDRLLGRIKEVLVAEKPVEGEKLFNISQSIEEKSSDSVRLLSAVASDFPEKAVEIKLGSPQVIRQVPGGKTEFRITLEFGLAPEFIDRFSKALDSVALKKTDFRDLAQITTEANKLNYPRSTGVVVKQKYTFRFFRISPELYWSAVAGMLTASNWLPEMPYNFYTYGTKHPYPDLFLDNMPYIQISLLDSAGTEVDAINVEGFGECSLLGTTETHADEGGHRLLYFANGLLRFVYYKTGSAEDRNLAEITGVSLPVNVMTIPPAGYTPEGIASRSGGGTNGRYALYVSAGTRTTRDYTLVVDTARLQEVTKITARYVSPLKSGANAF